MIFFDVFFGITGILVLVVMAYLWFLAIVSLVPEKKLTTFSRPRTKFAIIIPANDEVSIIGATLESVKKLDYPSALFETIVIADNCQDDTAGVARRSGVWVLERRSEEHRGKGYALKWVFEKLTEKNHLDAFDAFVIIDADTVVDSQFLRAMDRRVASGEKAVQGYYAVMDEESSPMASLSCLGFALSRNLKYKGRTRLGWSSNLLGNGMCFSKEVIKRFGWGATSIVEDMEYAVVLLLNGIRVSFAPEAMVFAEIPETFKGSRIQRSRWDIGRFQVRNRYLGKLVMEGIRTRHLTYFDTAMELLVPPFSLFVVLCLFLFILFLLFSSGRFEFLSLIWYINIFFLFAYIITGLIKAKAHFKTYLHLVYAPFFLAWRVQTMAWGYFAKIGKVWLKTARKDGR